MLQPEAARPQAGNPTLSAIKETSLVYRGKRGFLCNRIELIIFICYNLSKLNSPKKGVILIIFHRFSSKEERRAYGGSAFIELQFCNLPSGTRIKKIVSVRAITHWKDDSLYIHVDDIDLFYQNYSPVFNCGTYNNLRTGPVDLYGINYYAPEQIEFLLGRILDKKPSDYEVLVDWLTKARAFNGFYVLGV